MLGKYEGKTTKFDDMEEEEEEEEKEEILPTEDNPIVNADGDSNATIPDDLLHSPMTPEQSLRRILLAGRADESR